ncbi:MAG TPA: hypothetical protein VHQ86_01090 [Candidatus Saccharimonadia bacterium]|jgi:hypothetical protein|nr:hypothetical protein [Candidatus Saccharimonadia bacterium]
MDQNRKLVYLLWTVITVLIIGAGVGAFLLLRHTNSVDDANAQLNSDNSFLRRQLKEAQATPSPSPTPTPLATPEPTPTPSVSPSPSPSASPTPTPKH